MIKTKFFAASLFACAAAGLPLWCHAAPSNTAYATLGYTGATLGNNHPSVWSIRGGYYFAPQLAGVIQVLNRGNGDGGVIVESGAGAFVRGEAPVGRRFRIYVLAGYAYTDLIGPLGNKITISSLAYGAGAELDLGSRTSLDLDYIRYDDSRKVNGINAGVKFSF